MRHAFYSRAVNVKEGEFCFQLADTTVADFRSAFGVAGAGTANAGADVVRVAR